jgi:hypothetical protein
VEKRWGRRGEDDEEGEMQGMKWGQNEGSVHRVAGRTESKR